MPKVVWPELVAADVRPTLETLHLWAQVVGKVKLACLPWLNESWHVPLLVSARGLTTGLVTHGSLGFELEFDFIAGKLVLNVTDGVCSEIDLGPGSVAAFLASVGDMLEAAGIGIAISPRPSEIRGALPFAEDRADRPFDLAAARAFHLALVQVQRVFHRFRSRFDGKCSPIHFFWGSFDLAVTRFSGRPAPEVTSGGPNFSVEVARDAYANEQAGCGFWPGGGVVEEAAFYIEAWPVPEGFRDADLKPSGARWVDALGEWVLDYAVVRESADPDANLLAFLQSGYDAIADAGGWHRARLERPEGPIGHPPERTARPDPDR